MLFGVGALLMTLPASAERVGRLVYTRGLGAEACPDEAALRHAIVARLGEDPFDAAVALTFHAEIVAVGDKLIGHVTLTEEGGTPSGLREFEAANGCDELVSAMALAISLAINPNLASSGEPPEAPLKEPRADSSEPVAAASPAPPATKPPRGATKGTPAGSDPHARTHETTGATPSRSSTEGLRMAVGAFGLGSIGTAPGPAVGAAVAARGRRGALSVALEGRFDSPSSSGLASGGRVQSMLVAGLLAPCWHFGAFALCGVGLVGRLQAASRGLNASGSDAGAYAAAGARVGAEQPISGHLSLDLRLDLLATLTRLRVLRNQQPVWSAPWASASIGLGVMAEIP